MNQKERPLLVFVPLFTAVFLLTTFFLATATADNDTSWTAKVDPYLRQPSAQNDGDKLDVLVEFAAQADLTFVVALPDKTSRGAFVHEQLTAVAESSQRDVQRWLNANKLSFRSYAINNSLWVQLPAALLPELAQRPEVAYVHANRAFRADLPLTAVSDPTAPNTPSTIEWGVERIGAPLLWQAGITGTGVVIGGQDTGYDWDHPALKNQYRGWNAITQTVNHNYQWHDAIREDLSGNGTNNACGFDSPEPCDDNRHGTHTMGTMVGDDGGANQIGVAPGAEWIACRNMEEGYGTPQTYIECFDWFLAPTDLAGQNPRPDLAPHVINNSWSCPASEGCNDSNFGLMETAVDNLRSAGVVVVVSAGNSGASGCNTVNTPAAFFESSFTVGNTTSTDLISGSSSRGPVINYGTRMKPDISAPGTNIRSAILNGEYGYLSGTSMAGPHVAGALALIMSADPSLQGDPDALQALLQQNALPRTTSQGCGGDTPTSVPNNVYGHGRVDVFAAYQAITPPPPTPHQLSLTKTAPLTVSEGSAITYTLTLTHFHPTSPTTNVVLTDVLPLNTTFISATQPFTMVGDVIEWHWPSLASSETVAVQLVVSPTAVTTITNALYGAHDGTVSVMGQAVNTAVFTRTLPPPPPPVYTHTLALHKSATTAVMSNEPITYTLVLTHFHPTSPTTNIVLTDTLPLSTTLIQATAPYTQQGETISWQWDTRAPTQTVTVTLVVQPALGAFRGTIRNEFYGARSDQAAPVSGPPVLTLVNPLQLYLPVVSRE